MDRYSLLDQFSLGSSGSESAGANKVPDVGLGYAGSVLPVLLKLGSPLQDSQLIEEALTHGAGEQDQSLGVAGAARGNPASRPVGRPVSIRFDV